MQELYRIGNLDLGSYFLKEDNVYYVLKKKDHECVSRNAETGQLHTFLVEDLCERPEWVVKKYE